VSTCVLEKNLLGGWCLTCEVTVWTSWVWLGEMDLAHLPSLSQTYPQFGLQSLHLLTSAFTLVDSPVETWAFLTS
jgi:hypothetical protein